MKASFLWENWLSTVTSFPSLELITVAFPITPVFKVLAWVSWQEPLWSRWAELGEGNCPRTFFFGSFFGGKCLSRQFSSTFATHFTALSLFDACFELESSGLDLTVLFFLPYLCQMSLKPKIHSKLEVRTLSDRMSTVSGMPGFFIRKAKQRSPVASN